MISPKILMTLTMISLLTVDINSSWQRGSAQYSQKKQTNLYYLKYFILFLLV